MTPSLFLQLVILVVLLYTAITAVDFRKGIIAFLLNRPLPVYFEFFPRRLPVRYRQFLIQHEKFFRSLSPNLQRSYGSRLMKFLGSKDFKTRDGLKLTTEMKLLIASAAIKISFGLRDFSYPIFHTIIIYSDEFYSKVSNLYVKGETNASGVIVFSWADLKYGNDIPDDSINLGYHEFAHALFLDQLMSGYETVFKEHYREWLVFIAQTSKLEEVRERQVFRDYAAVNEQEFFAVALENFFEKPDYFKAELPQLYKLMAEMLNQDLSQKQ